MITHRTANTVFLLTAAVVLAVITAALSTPSYAEPSEMLKIRALDVGQGDAMILHQPGACTAVIDTGGLLYGHRVTETLQGMGVTAVDLLIISHPHLDHFGGLFDLAPRLPIKQLFDNGGSNPVHDYFDDYRSLRHQRSIAQLQRGDHLSCGSIDIDVLHPAHPPQQQDDINAFSLALRITFNNFHLLHLGDLTGNGEDALLAKNDDLTADLLKIAHHGAGDGTSARLLQRVAPTHAIISCGKDNRTGAPAKQVLKRLTAAGISVLRTDRDGTVEITISADSSGRTPVIEVNSD